jgi:endoglucanase
MRLLKQTAIRSAGLIAATLVIMVLTALLMPDPPQAATSDIDIADWEAFRALYISGDGRVIDTANGGISHSEGQGYGMLLAVEHNDRASFDRMRRWTEQNLARQGDHLHAWRYDPKAENHVADPNNATDGDLFIAWALVRAGARWNDRTYTTAGAAIARDILRDCVINYHGQMILAPGLAGFEHSDGFVLNLSYYSFTAFRALARVVPDRAWAKLESDGLALMRQAQFGPWDLPPDWVLLTPDHHLRPADGWPARFSWDAVRVPLHLAWAGQPEAALKNSVAFWTEEGTTTHPRAWASVIGNEVAAQRAGAGISAIMDFSLAALGTPAATPWPHVRDAQNYYDAALVLLARMAARETHTAIPSTPEPPRVAQKLAAGAAPDTRAAHPE